MKITNKEVLAAFARKHADVVNPLNKWIDTVEDNMFRNHHEIKALFPSADYVGNSRYVFNIKGNNYRMVIMITFVAGFLEGPLYRDTSRIRQNKRH